MIVRFFLLSFVLVLTALVPLLSADLTESAFESFPRRSLRQNALEACRWDPAVSQCVISRESLATLLDASDSPYAKFLLRFAECGIQGTDPETCVALDDCGWERGSERCQFVDYVQEYSTSPCVYPVANIWEYSALFDKCPYLNSTECSAFFPNCAWDVSSEVCYADFFMVHFGIETERYNRDTNLADQTKATEVYAIFQSEFDYDFLDPEWSAALEWEMPETDCPEEAHPLACEYVDAYLPLLLPTTFYCMSKYDPPLHISSCTADDLCEYDASRGRCVQDDSITRQTLEEADKVLLALISQPLERDIVQVGLHCLHIRNEEECSGDCLWSSTACVVDPFFTRNQTVFHAEDHEDDPVCLLYGIPLRHDCVLQTTATSCEENEQCVWRYSTHECTVTDEEFMNVVRAEDRNLAEAWLEQDKACRALDTPSECQSAT